MIEDITKTPLRKGDGLAIGVLRPSLADYFQPANQSSRSLIGSNEGLNLPGGTA